MSDTESPAGFTQERWPVLRCLDTTTGENYEVVVNKPVFQMGRDASCDLHLPNPLVSNRHARLERRGLYYYLIDTSHNGSRLSGEPVHQAEIGPLSHNDVITICSQSCYQLTFLLPSSTIQPKTITDLYPYKKITVRLDFGSYLYHYLIPRNPVLLLFGVAGSGKTHLLSALTDQKLQEYFHQGSQFASSRYWKARPTLLYLDTRLELEPEEINPASLVAIILKALQYHLDSPRAFIPGSSFSLTDWRNQLQGLIAGLETARNSREVLLLLTQGLQLWLTRLQIPLVLLLDHADTLLEKLPPAFWRDFIQTIKNLPAATATNFVHLLLAGRLNGEIWQEQVLSNRNATERPRLERDFAALRVELKNLALEALKDDEAQLIANYNLIEAGGAPNTRQERLETAFERMPMGCYRNGVPIDGASFQFIASRAKELAGLHPGLLRAISLALVQYIEPPTGSNLPDLRFLATSPQAEVALIQKLLENERVLDICIQIELSLTPEQRRTLTVLGQAEARLPERNSRASFKVPENYWNSNFDWTSYLARGLAFERPLDATLPYPRIFSPVFGSYLAQRYLSNLSNSGAEPRLMGTASSQNPNLDVLELVRQNFQPQQCWLTADLERRTVSLCGYQPIPISAPEIWKLFKFFYEHPYQVLDKNALIDYMYRHEGHIQEAKSGGRPLHFDESDIRRFEAVLKRLRQQIEPWREERNMIFLVNRHNAFEFCPGSPPVQPR